MVCDMKPQDPLHSFIAHTNHGHDPARTASWRTRAQELHEVFVRDLVEAHDFCPWAKSARAAQRSKIVALFVPELQPFCVGPLVHEAYEAVEVWQLVLPDVTLSAMGWRAYVADLEQTLRRDGHDLPWAFAAFHPEHPGRAESIGGTIGMLRRSPLPTIQLVRLHVLDRVRARASERVEALPAQNQPTLQQWLHDKRQRQQQAKWLKDGKELQAEIARAAASKHR